jgi:hypothetical protein
MPVAVETDVRPWERQDNESQEAWEAFGVYLEMGAQRSLAKTATHLGKSDTLMEGWSSRHKWGNRVLLYNRQQARITNDRVWLGNADMRERIATQAVNMQHRVAKRVLSMTEAEIAKLSPRECVALFNAARRAEMDARDIPEDQRGFSETDQVPRFNVNFIISKPDGMVSVRLATGEAGYIPKESIDQFKEEYPDAMVIA